MSDNNDSFGNRTVSWILKVAVATLSLCTLLVVGVLLAALYFQEIDSDAVFTIIGPAVNTIIGAFVGLLGGLTISNFTASNGGGGNSKPPASTDKVNTDSDTAGE